MHIYYYIHFFLLVLRKLKHFCGPLKESEALPVCTLCLMAGLALLRPTLSDSGPHGCLLWVPHALSSPNPRSSPVTYLPAVPGPVGSPAARSGSGPRSGTRGHWKGGSSGKAGQPGAGNLLASGWHRCHWLRPAHPAAKKWTRAAHPLPGRAAPVGAPAQPLCPPALHKGQLGACSTACRDSQHSLDTAVPCEPPSDHHLPYGFDSLQALARGKGQDLTLGRLWGSKRETGKRGQGPAI